jgi:hypothetical protein
MKVKTVVDVLAWPSFLSFACWTKLKKKGVAFRRLHGWSYRETVIAAPVKRHGERHA